MRWTWNKLPSDRSAVEVFHGPSPPFPFQSSFETKSSNSNLYFYVNHTCWRIKRVIPKEIDQRFQKLPLFPIINTSPHKRPTFDKRDNVRVLTKQKALFHYFQNFSSGSWSIYCFGLYFLPLWHQAPKRDQSWPWNPIASPKFSIKSKWQ